MALPSATLLLVPALLALAAAKEDCGNGNVCLSFQTCVSTEPGAGRMFGCSPAPDAVICNDARYSCPDGYTCDLTGEICREGDWGHVGAAVPLLHNTNATASSAENEPRLKKLCDILEGDLPARCTCTDAPLGGVVACKIGVLFEDSFGVKINLLPCDDVAHLDVEVTESKHHINYTIAGVSTGKSKNIPIPGLTVGIPKIGQADVDATVELDGSLSDLAVKVGVNACASVAGKEICGSDLTKYLPYWILHGTYHFKGICPGDDSFLDMLVV